MKLAIDFNQIKRYLKYDSNDVDRVTLNNINKAIDIVESMANYSYLLEFHRLSLDKNCAIIDDKLKFESKDLFTHLKNCDEVVIVVVSLGIEIDYLIRKLEVQDIALAYVLNAVSVEYIEKYLDYIIENKLKTDKNQTSRFSIGYGDLHLEFQSKLLNYVESSKKVGVSVLDTNIMVPSKSISALIGLSYSKVNSELKKCDSCLDSGLCSGLCIGKED